MYLYKYIYIYWRANGIYISKKLQHMDSLSLFYNLTQIIVRLSYIKKCIYINIMRFSVFKFEAAFTLNICKGVLHKMGIKKYLTPS